MTAAVETPTVPEEHGATVQRMFDDISPRYDLTNRVLSAGVDPLWRRAAVRCLADAVPLPGARLLDVATGTGDLALALARAAGADGSVVGADFSERMLAQAPAKEAAARRRRATLAPIEWLQADALALPLDDDRFDGATIAFGIRNVSDPVQGLAEMRRVVRPGGAVVVLEFGQPDGWLFGPLFRVYSKLVMPRVGGLLTGHRYAYEYLPRTSAAFPCGEGFTDLMERAGLTEITRRPLTFGIAWLYRGIVR